MRVGPTPDVRAKLRVEPFLERVNLASQRGIARVQQVAAADRIRVRENVGGINEATASVHQHRHGAAVIALRGKSVQQGRVRLFPVRQRDPVERPARLLAVVAEWDSDEDGGIGIAVRRHSSVAPARCW